VNIVFDDEATRPYVSRYFYALLDKLGVHRHSFQEILKRNIQNLPPQNRKSLVIPTADQEEALLQTLSAKVIEKHSRFYEVFGEALPVQLRRIACFFLAETARNTESQTMLINAGKAIPLGWERAWDNPIRFLTNPTTGERTLGDIQARTPQRLIMDAQALLRVVEPGLKRGRKKGCEKPKNSGREKPPDEILLKAYIAKQKYGKNKTIPWWQRFAKDIGERIPDDPKGREAARKRYEDWALRGKKIDQ